MIVTNKYCSPSFFLKVGPRWPPASLFLPVSEFSVRISFYPVLFVICYPCFLSVNNWYHTSTILVFHTVMPQIFGKENRNPCTFAIVSGSVAVVYRMHHRR
jgi:hypothetical protein